MTDLIQRKFEKWWQNEGCYLDPDTSDVSWFDKRKELAGLAFHAAISDCRAEIERQVEAVRNYANGHANGAKLDDSPSRYWLSVAAKDILSILDGKSK